MIEKEQIESELKEIRRIYENKIVALKWFKEIFSKKLAELEKKGKKFKYTSTQAKYFGDRNNSELISISHNNTYLHEDELIISIKSQPGFSRDLMEGLKLSSSIYIHMRNDEKTIFEAIDKKLEYNEKTIKLLDTYISSIPNIYTVIQPNITLIKYILYN